MEMITELDFKKIISNYSVIKQQLNLPKVLNTDCNKIIKIFYAKGKCSSDYFKPYALRFCKNANTLKNLGVMAPQIIKIQYCVERQVYLVYYEKIIGKDLEVLVQSGQKDLFEKLATFLASLHEKGINFRSIHLGNLIYQNEEMALIDI